jgi:hypothetical protein
MSNADTHTDDVFVDPITELYHRRDDLAGDNPTRFSRPQAVRFGYRPCPTCYRVDRPTDDVDPVAGGVGA